jgi:serine/threonine-protein kinase
MAPEQWTGQAGPQADIYSLGVVLYELVTGRKPYSADTPAAILLKQANDPLPPPRQFTPGLPEAVERILYKALAKKPEDRYQSMGEFGIVLEGLLAGQNSPSQAVPQPAEPRPSWNNARPKIAQDLTRDVLPPTPAGGLASVSPSPRPKGTFGATAIRWLAWGIGAAALLLVVAVVWSLASHGRIPAPAFTETSSAVASPVLTATQHPTYTSQVIETSRSTDTATAPSLPTPTLGIGSIWTRPTDGMEMVYVPEGEFLMGSTDSDNTALVNEKPQHTVYLDAFWIDITEVTNAMYAKCVQAGSCQPPFSLQSSTRTDYYNNPQYAEFPVIFMHWNDAQSYCKWAGARLPSEAEWEKAARGTDGRTYPWGNNPPTCSLVNSNRCTNDTTSVGSYPSGASPYQALDMAGNVWEWVNDWYNGTYYSYSPTSNPQGPPSGDTHVLRGGTWWVNAPTSYRYWYFPAYSYFDPIGFRCARSQ